MLGKTITVLRRVHVITKWEYLLRRFSLSTRNNSAASQPIVMRCYVWNFLKNLTRK